MDTAARPGKDELFDHEIERIDRINENLTLISRKDGLLFGTDSFFLAAFARPFPCGKAVELGAGYGAVSLLCAEKNKYAHITAVELRLSSYSVCKRNVLLNSLSDRVTVLNADVRELNPEILSGQADAILTNPPYMPTGTGKYNLSDEMNAARRELNGGILDFCSSASKLLKYGGLFNVIFRPERLCDLFSAMRNVKIEPKRVVFIHPFSDAPPSLVLVEGKSGASPGTVISRPLIIYEKRGSERYTSDTEKIYETFSTEHLFSRSN